MRQLTISAIFALVFSLRGTISPAEDLSSEVEKLRSVIEALTKRIEMQDQRIAALERLLKGQVGIESVSERDNPTKQLSESLKGWRNPANWKRIKSGMSQPQVREILGPPTSTEGPMWYYEGNVPGSGNITGNIFWISRQVGTVRQPVF